MDQELSVRGAVAAGAPQLPLTGPRQGRSMLFGPSSGAPRNSCPGSVVLCPVQRSLCPVSGPAGEDVAWGRTMVTHCPVGAAFFSSSKPNGGSQAEGPQPPVRPCQVWRWACGSHGHGQDHSTCSALPGCPDLQRLLWKPQVLALGLQGSLGLCLECAVRTCGLSGVCVGAAGDTSRGTSFHLFQLRPVVLTLAGPINVPPAHRDGSQVSCLCGAAVPPCPRPCSGLLCPRVSLSCCQRSLST